MHNFQNFNGFFGMDLNWFFGGGFLFFLLLLIWTLIWKGLALWKAAHAGSSAWFVVLLVLNTLGILEILYIYVFSKKNKPVK